MGKGAKAEENFRLRNNKLKKIEWKREMIICEDDFCYLLKFAFAD